MRSSLAMHPRGARRAPKRAAAAILVATAAIVAVSCGASGRGAETDSEKAADVELLNAALASELTAVDAYRRGLVLLPDARRPMARLFLAHQREYVDALTKATRGLGGQTDAEPEELDLGAVRSESDFLERAYELESAALALYLDAAPRLFNQAPRALAASLAAGHAQHLVLLRQGLGASLSTAAPEAFDGGQVPLPLRGRASPSGAG
jgi:rubrerythrin